jgi:hypothetical protein
LLSVNSTNPLAILPTYPAAQSGLCTWRSSFFLERHELNIRLVSMSKNDQALVEVVEQTPESKSGTIRA